MKRWLKVGLPRKNLLKKILFWLAVDASVQCVCIMDNMYAIFFFNVHKIWDIECVIMWDHGYQIIETNEDKCPSLLNLHDLLQLHNSKHWHQEMQHLNKCFVICMTLNTARL